MSIEYERSQSPEYKESNCDGIKSAAVSVPANSLAPQDNADSLLYLPESGFFGVFDGAGKGNPSSKIVRDQFVFTRGKNPGSRAEAEQELRETFEKAVNVNELAEKENDPDGSKEMYYMTTATVARIYKVGGRRLASILHLGDSRLVALFRDKPMVTTYDESRVYQYRRNGLITPIQARIFQHYIDEIEDDIQLGRYVSRSGEDLDPPENMEQEAEYLEKGAYPVGDFIKQRQVLGNAIRSQRRTDVDCTPNISSIPLDNCYGIAIMTDGFLDNIQSSRIYKELELLQLEGTEPKDVIDTLLSISKNSDGPKISRDDKTVEIIKL